MSGSATSFQLVSSGFTSSSFDRPTPSITWPTPAAISYGTALSSAQLNASASYNGVNVPGTFEYIPTAGEVLDAGSQTLVVTFFPTDSVNYSPTSGSAVLQINPSSSLQPLTIYNFSITSYAPNGNLQNYTDSVTGTWRLSYDSLNRLIAGTPATGNNLCWSYDSFGNRTAQTSQSSACPTLPSVPTATASYNTNNQVAWTTVNGASSGFSYDAAGNVLSDNVNAYIYDGEGRICAVKSEPVAGTYTMTQYIYDAEGTRVAKGFITNWAAGCNTAANGFTPTNSYVLGPSNEQLTETDGNGNWIHSNVYAAGMLIATYDTAPTGNPALHFQLEDWLGSRRMQTDISGNPEEIFTNLPFGDGLARAIASGAPSTADDATEHHFTGKERDTESGNDYFEARYFGSSMGRFMSPDWSEEPDTVPYAEFENPQTLNLYSYARNNPLVYNDPDGHDVNVCDNNGQCHQMSNDQYAAAQKAGNGGLNVPTLNTVGMNGDGNGQFNSTAITDSSGKSVGSATYVSDGPTDYYANRNGLNVLANASATVGSVKGVASFYGASALLGAGVAASPLMGAGASLTTLSIPMGLQPGSVVGGFVLTAHAVEQAEARGVTLGEIEEAVEGVAKSNPLNGYDSVQRFYTATCEVRVNKITGTIVTVISKIKR